MKGTLQIIRMTGKLTIYAFVLTTVLFNSILAGTVHSQAVKSVKEAKISIDIDDVSLAEALRMIENNSEYYFAYKDSELKENNDVRISVNADDQTFESLLLEISRQANVSFRQVNDRISVRQVSKNAQHKNDRVVVQTNVSGIITDENGVPLPGATILEKGTSNGTVTDIEGKYALSVSRDATLSISFVGYESMDVSINGRSVIDVSLNPDISSLEEVVVIGYGTQKKSDLTGSVASVKAEDLTAYPAVSAIQALQGRAAGLQIQSTNGEPGSAHVVRIRGASSINAASDPIYVVDGFVGATLPPPEDIASIEVLKDASATAIYGARAGNGVVIITTKRGNNERARISYDAYTSWNALDATKYDRLSGPEWAEITAKTNFLNGVNVYNGQAFIERILAGERPQEHDWVDELTRTGRIESHNLSVTGGSENSNYFSSLSYFDQDGVVYGSDLERFTLRLNSDHKIGKRVKIGNTLLLSRSKSNRQSNVNPQDNSNDYIKRTVSVNPYKPIYGPDGYYAGSDDHDPDADGIFDQDPTHIIWAAKENLDLYTSNRAWTSAYLDFEVIDGLTLHTMASIDFNYQKREDRNDFNNIEGTQLVLNESTSLTFRNNEDRTWFIENTATYDKSFGKHKITALLGSQFQNSLSTFFQVSDGAFENTDYWFYSRPKIVNPSDPSIPFVIPSANNGQAESGVNSYFGRIFYDFAGKYLVTATVRRDGSSKFGLDRRWGTFPAISVAWRLTEETFMPDLPWLTDLKLRGGYGISGSDNVGNYQYAAALGQGGNYSYSFDGGEIFGATLSRNANRVIQWEEIKMGNIAFDASLFDGRLNLTADFYDKTTSGLFLPFAPSLELGAELNPSGNLGEVSNKGVDISINSINMRGQFTWTTDVVFGTVKNKVISLPENADRFAGDGWQNRVYNITRVGEEIGAIYGFELDGIFQNWDEVYAHAYQDQALLGFDTDNNPIYDTNARDSVTMRSSTSPGDFRFKDLNGDGFIDNDGDRTIIGSTIPDFTWGLTNTFSYKGILLSVFFQGVHGVNVVNTLKNDYTTRERLEAWDGEGSSTTQPRLAGNGNGRTSSYRVEDASYVRLKNLRLGYSLPRQLLDPIGLGEFQIYGTATNLFTMTKYTGYDPEVGLRSGGDNEEAGVDRGQYPYTRQFTIGFKVSF